MNDEMISNIKVQNNIQYFMTLLIMLHRQINQNINC